SFQLRADKGGRVCPTLSNHIWSETTTFEGDGQGVQEGVRGADELKGEKRDTLTLCWCEVHETCRPLHNGRGLFERDTLRSVRHSLNDPAISDVDQGVLDGGEVAHEPLTKVHEGAGHTADLGKAKVSRK